MIHLYKTTFALVFGIGLGCALNAVVGGAGRVEGCKVVLRSSLLTLAQPYATAVIFAMPA